MIQINYIVKERYDRSGFGMHLYGDIIIEKGGVSVYLTDLYISQTLNDLIQILFDFKSDIAIESVNLSIEEELIISISGCGDEGIAIDIDNFIKIYSNYTEMVKSVSLALEKSSRDKTDF
jgi:hypothetical protein